MPWIALLAAALSPHGPGGPAGPVGAGCSMRSIAAFPDLRRDPASVRVGPLVLAGAAFTPAATVREFGGDKVAALVRTAAP